jgi:hypothetical protein
MTFTRENLRYCLLAFAGWEKTESDHYTSEDIPLSGLFNWSIALNGVRAFPRTREDAAKYNLVHVNITQNNLNMLPQLDELLDRSVTKVMYNVDYALEMWYPSFRFPTLFLREMDKADYIFAVEEQMADLLSQLLKRPVEHMPHPCAVDKLKALQKTGDAARRTEIGVSIHSYETNLLLPALAFRLAGLEKSKWILSLIGDAGANAGMVAHLYSHIIGQIKYSDLMRHLAESYAIIESYTLRSYGRLTIDCAALAVPVIGSRCVDSQRFLFPDLCTDNNEITKQAALLKQLINEPAFWSHCVEKALDIVEYYSFESCAKRMLAFLNT